MSNEIRNDSLEPDIAELLDDSLVPSGNVPDFSKLMGVEEETPESETVDTSKNCFEEITQFEQPPQKYFYNPNYYKIALAGEGESSQALHKSLALFLKAESNDDKTRFRARVITSFWDTMRSLATKIGPSLKLPKKLTIRYGALLPTLISPKQRDMLSRIIMENNTGEPVHYMDEWLQRIALGQVNPLATDEVQMSKQNKDQKLMTSLHKTKGSQEACMNTIMRLQRQRTNIEDSLMERVKNLKHHNRHSLYPELETLMTDGQRSSIAQISNLGHQLTKLDREMRVQFEKLGEASKDLERLNRRVKEQGGESAVDTSVLAKEVDSLRQMVKLCIGRQGNHFPILMKQYFSENLQFIATRENILKEMKAIEDIDPGVFCRIYRQESNRIVPNVIILPCYGDKGICWEPYEKFNKSTSRGRIAMPLFPKDTKLALISAAGDLRWQVAKEKAAHYWMEEGLTGHYYDWFSKKKLKGDVKDKFIEDYILWITKESAGLQKLDKEVRAIFWRLMPFPQSIKENLKNRGFAYAELCKRDQNRAMSDGY